MRTPFWIIVAALMLGCGKPADTTQLEEAPDSVGDEEPFEEVADAEQDVEEPQAPAATGPSRITVKATVKGEPASAHVKLLDSSGEVAAEGEAGQPLSVPSGDYGLEVQITDEKALVDKPTRRQNVTLLAGGDITQDVAFPWARIQLNVRVNGKPTKSAVVRVIKQGAEVLKVKSGAPHVPISPGRYEAEVKTKGAVVNVKGLMFPEGGTHGVPVDVQI